MVRGDVKHTMPPRHPWPPVRTGRDFLADWRGAFDDKNWFAVFSPKGPTTEAHRRKVLHGHVLIENRIGNLVVNPVVARGFLELGQDQTSREALFNALLCTGMGRPEAHCVKAGTLHYDGFVFLDSLANRLADPPCEETGRTALDALIDALRAVVPAPKKPTKKDNDRFKASELGVKHQIIADQENKDVRTIEASIAKVRDWREYHGIASPPKGLRGKKRALNSVNEPQTPAARITISATLKTTK